MTEVFTTVEAAKALGVAPATIRSWIHRGQLRPGRMRQGALVWTMAQLLAAQRGDRIEPVDELIGDVSGARCKCGGSVTLTVKPGMGWRTMTCERCSTGFAIPISSDVGRRTVPSDVRFDEVTLVPGQRDEKILRNKSTWVRAFRLQGEPAVYFIRLGIYVKIGTSRNVRRRITSLSLSETNLLAVMPGGREIEKDMHLRFKTQAAFREWFYLDGELLEFVDQLQVETLAEVETRPPVSGAP